MPYEINDIEVNWFTYYVLFPLGLWRPPLRVKKHAVLKYEQGPHDKGKPKEVYFLFNDGTEAVAEAWTALKGFKIKTWFDYTTGLEVARIADLEKAVDRYIKDAKYPTGLTQEHLDAQERLGRWGVNRAEINKLKDLAGRDLRDPIPLRPHKTGTQDP